MKCIISLCIAVVTIALAWVEWVFIGFGMPASTREWLVVALPSLIVVFITIGQITMLEKKKKIFTGLGGGLLLIAFLYTAIHAVHLIPQILDALPESDGALYLVTVFFGICYVPVVYVVAFWLYFHVYINVRNYQF